MTVQTLPSTFSIELGFNTAIALEHVRETMGAERGRDITIEQAIRFLMSEGTFWREVQRTQPEIAERAMEAVWQHAEEQTVKGPEH